MQRFRQNRGYLFLFVAVVLSLTSCTYDNVEVKEIRNLKIDKLDQSGISFTATLWIENPNSYRIKVTSTDADLYLGGKHAGQARLLDNMVVPSQYKGPVEAKVRTDFDQGSLSLLPVVVSAGLKRKVDLRAVGYVRARSFIIGRKFDFDYAHEAKF